MQIQSSSSTSLYPSKALSNAVGNMTGLPTQQHIDGGLAPATRSFGASIAPGLTAPKVQANLHSADVLGKQMDANMNNFSAGETAVARAAVTPMAQWGGIGLEVLARVQQFFAADAQNHRKNEIHHQTTQRSLVGFKQASLLKQATETLSAAAGGAAVSTALSVGGTGKSVKSMRGEAKGITKMHAPADRGLANVRARATLPQANVPASRGGLTRTENNMAQLSENSGLKSVVGNAEQGSYEMAVNKGMRGRQTGQMISDLSRPASTLADASRSTMSLHEQSVQVGLDALLETEKTAAANAQDIRQEQRKVVDDARQAMRGISSSNLNAMSQIAAQIRV